LFNKYIYFNICVCGLPTTVVTRCRCYDVGNPKQPLATTDVVRKFPRNYDALSEGIYKQYGPPRRSAVASSSSSSRYRVSRSPTYRRRRATFRVRRISSRTPERSPKPEDTADVDRRDSIFGFPAIYRRGALDRVVKTLIRDRNAFFRSAVRRRQKNNGRWSKTNGLF